MNESKVIEIMYEMKFSTKQINTLKKLSARYSTSLYVTVHELAGRFFRSLFIHIFSFAMVFHSYIYHSEIRGYSLGGLVLSIITLAIAFFIFDLFAPLVQGYKARKVIKTIQKNHRLNS